MKDSQFYMILSALFLIASHTAHSAGLSVFLSVVGSACAIASVLLTFLGMRDR